MGLRQCSMRSAGGVEYELTRKRGKNLNLRVRGDGSVAVSAPPRAPLAAVDAFVAGRAGWIAAAQAKMHRRQAAEAAQAAPGKKECLALFLPVSERVFPLFEGVLGGQRPELRVRDMRTRWGSCNVKERRITLAARLALMPPEAVEYVVVHEYCHFVHPDHQAGFWALVAGILPDYKARRALLKMPPQGDKAD